MALTFGITPLVGELFAKGKLGKSSKLLHNGIVLFPAIGVIGMSIQFMMIPLMHYMGQPQHIVDMAIPYYSSLVWSMVPIMVFFSFKQFLEGLGDTMSAMYIVITANIINVILNWVLINGECGFPEMGVLGAGVATLISRTLQAVVVVAFFLLSKRYKSHLRSFRWDNVSQKSCNRLMRIGVPISLQVFLESSVFVITGIIMGQFGETAISANQIAITMSNCAFLIALSIGSAATIRISHCYGSHNIEEMKLATNASWHLSTVWGILTAVVFYSMRFAIPHLFTTNEEVIAIASTILVIVGLYQIPDSIQCISIGVLRGMQDVKIVTPIAIISYWLLNFPIGYYCAFTLGMGPKGLYIGLFVGLTVAAILLYFRITRHQRKMVARR